MIEKMKSICVVAQNSGREELLKGLRNLGIFHISEKKNADPAFTQRFNLLSKMLIQLKDYVGGEQTCEHIITDNEFEEIYENDKEIRNEA